MARTQLLRFAAAAALLLALPAALGQLDCSRMPGCSACEEATLSAPPGRALLGHGLGPRGVGDLLRNATGRLPAGFNLTALEAMGHRLGGDGYGDGDGEGGRNGTAGRLFPGDGFKRLNMSRLAAAAAGLKPADLSRLAPKLNLTAAEGEARGLVSRIAGALRPAAGGRKLLQRGGGFGGRGAMGGGMHMGGRPFDFNATGAMGGRPPRPDFAGNATSRPFFGAPAGNRTVLMCTACTAPAYQLAASGGRCECAPGYGMQRPVAPAAGTTATPPTAPSCQRCPAGQVSGPNAPVPATLPSSPVPGASPAPGDDGAFGMRFGGGHGHGYPCVACPSGTSANADQTQCL